MHVVAHDVVAIVVVVVVVDDDVVVKAVVVASIGIRFVCPKMTSTAALQICTLGAAPPTKSNISSAHLCLLSVKFYINGQQMTYTFAQHTFSPPVKCNYIFAGDTLSHILMI